MYDFDEIIDRSGTNSLKWDIKENEVPMWVADMDFRVAKPIIEAIKKRTENGIFGYSIVPSEWNKAYIDWWKKRHHFEFKEDDLIFCTGVVPAISSIVRKLTTPAENVLLQTPVYNIFFNSILNNGRNVLENELIYEDGKYRIDFEDLERKLAYPQTTMMILCNPHNPIGKIWDADTLKRIGDLCNKYHVIVVSDEIHCDITALGKEYVPFASVSKECEQNSITCIAPSKAFNIAGMQTAAVMIPNEFLRNKVNRGLNTDEVAEPNVFAVTTAIAAFSEGETWLDEFREYVQNNRKLVGDFIKSNFEDIRLVEADATYLCWLDCKDLCKKITRKDKDLAELIREKSGLYLTSGHEYGELSSEFLRMNIACPKSQVEKGLKLLKEAVEELK